MLGALLFAAYGWLDRGTTEAPGEIVVDAARAESLAAQFQQVWLRPPTAQEREGLIETFVREEILYREGLALGLDRDDPVVRRRVGQKLSFLADGLAPEEPTEAELRAWLSEHAAVYAIEPRYSLRQVFFDPARHGDGLDRVLADTRASLAKGADADPLGDATLLPRTLERARASEIESAFGRDFATAIAALPTGVWDGPVRSAFGVHLVRVEARDEARTPALDEVRAAVERDLLRARTEEQSDAFYRKLRERYIVRINALAAQ